MSCRNGAWNRSGLIGCNITSRTNQLRHSCSTGSGARCREGSVLWPTVTSHCRISCIAREVRSYEEMLPVLVGAGFSRPNLGWFEALGLLRLLFRARSLASDDRPYHRVRVAVERAVYECAEAVA